MCVAAAQGCNASRVSPCCWDGIVSSACVESAHALAHEASQHLLLISFGSCSSSYLTWTSFPAVFLCIQQVRPCTVYTPCTFRRPPAIHHLVPSLAHQSHCSPPSTETVDYLSLSFSHHPHCHPHVQEAAPLWRSPTCRRHASNAATRPRRSWLVWKTPQLSLLFICPFVFSFVLKCQTQQPQGVG